MTTFWITDYETAAAILAHKAFEEVTFKGLVPLLGHVIVTLEGEAHRTRRNVEGRLFVTALLKSYEKTLIPAISYETVAPLANTGQACLVQICQTVTSRIAAKIIGLDELQDGTNSEEAIRYLSALVGGTHSYQSNENEPLLTRRAARNLLRERFIFRAIERRQRLVTRWQAGEISREELPHDLITLLLLHNNTQKPWTVKQIAGEASFYAVAAVDTTATLVPHLMHELWQFVAKKPEFGVYLQNLGFLRLAAAEAVRLHPALPTLFRRATQPVEINGQAFALGDVAGLYLTDTNRDPTIFGDDATSFNPLRPIPTRIRRAGLSFGGGTHLCLGRELATGTPDRTEGGFNPDFKADNSSELFGEAALLAQALFKLKARPDPAQPVASLDPYQRDVYHSYPILLN